MLDSEIVSGLCLSYAKTSKVIKKLNVSPELSHEKDETTTQFFFLFVIYEKKKTTKKKQKTKQKPKQNKNLKTTKTNKQRNKKKRKILIDSLTHKLKNQLNLKFNFVTLRSDLRC